MNRLRPFSAIFPTSLTSSEKIEKLFGGNWQILPKFHLTLPKFQLILPKFQLILPKNFSFPPKNWSLSSELFGNSLRGFEISRDNMLALSITFQHPTK